MLDLLKLILKTFIFLHLTKLFAKPGNVIYSHKTSTEEADTRGFSQAWSQLRLCSES